MIAYIDSSVLIRIVVNQPDALADWSRVEVGATSVLTRVECSRALQRLLRDGELSPDEYMKQRDGLRVALEQMLLLDLTVDVLNRAAEPFPHYVATLDAIHLATALLYRDTEPETNALHFATHDIQLAKAATAAGLRVIGV